jgi:hypothetical protein
MRILYLKKIELNILGLKDIKTKNTNNLLTQFEVTEFFNDNDNPLCTETV